MIEEEEKVQSFSTPRLDALDKLYVRVYLSTLSHPKAYEAVKPGLAKYHNDNPYSRKESIKFHISLKLQEQAEALSLTPELILSQLLKEATREGNGSNHAARIQALQILGKHLGLFVEKKEDTAHVINIINYGSQEIKEVNNQVVIEDLDDHSIKESLPENITLTEYN